LLLVLERDGETREQRLLLAAVAGRRAAIEVRHVVAQLPSYAIGGFPLIVTS
jgi:hypothetical protein